MAAHSRWRNGVRLLAAAVLVGVALQAQPVSVQAAPEAGSLSASPNGSVTVKEQVVLTGTLPPVRARAVTLQQRTGNGNWTNAGNATSNASGTFSFTVTMPAKVNTVVNYRVLANAATLGG